MENKKKLNRREILCQFDEYVREDYQLNNTAVNDTEWKQILFNKAIDSINNQLTMTKLYPAEAFIVKGRLENIYRQIDLLKDLVEHRYIEDYDISFD